MNNPLLHQPISIKNIKLKNRLVMPPMQISKGSEEGHASRATLDYYAEKSAGGHIGLIIAEHMYVSQEGKAHRGQLSIANDACLEGLTALVNAVHANGTPIFAQISHAGGVASRERTGKEVLGPSAAVLQRDGSVLTDAEDAEELPRAMTDEDIQKVVADFTAAAVRAKRAGFDGVEIHSAHGYLLNQFFSPLINLRDDEYTGTTIEGRLRLHLQIVRSIRDAVGDDYPIALRLGSCDYLPGGITLEDSVAAANILQNAGVDLVDVTGGLLGYTNPACKEPGWFSELSASIRNAVDVPVLVTGGVKTAEDAERMLRNGDADLVGVGRAIMRDSEWAARAMA